MTLARRVFAIAGIYGLIVILPMFAGPSRFTPPPLSHPVFYYGFASVALAWQVAFLIIARDPVRYRPLMLAAILEKLLYGITTVALYLTGEASPLLLGAAIVDLILGGFFVLAWIRTRE